MLPACWELTTAASDVATACWEEANSGWEVQNTKEGGGGGGCMRDHEQFPAEKKVTQKKTQVEPKFYFLEVKYYELLEMTFFFSPKTLLGVGKHRLFRRNI